MTENWVKNKTDSAQGLALISYIPRELWTNKPDSLTSSQEAQLTSIGNIRFGL